jgi:hypothetical protein
MGINPPIAVDRGLIIDNGHVRDDEKLGQNVLCWLMRRMKQSERDHPRYCNNLDGSLASAASSGITITTSASKELLTSLHGL